MEKPAADFIIIGENVHTTRAITAKSSRLTKQGGMEGLAFKALNGTDLFLPLSEELMAGQDYRQKRIKHVKLAVEAGMSDDKFSVVGIEYLRKIVHDQEQADAHYLDINVDEISVDPEHQTKAMRWLVEQVQDMSQLPLSIDSSSIDLIRTGLKAIRDGAERPLLNSASLERIEGLDLAREFNTSVIVTSAGQSAMPDGANERIENASQMVEAALKCGIDLADVFVDPLVFPISVDSSYGLDTLSAISGIRKRFGPGIRITGGMSNVSFGIPKRSVINTMFLMLALEAGADSGIIDPVMNPMSRVREVDRSSLAFHLAQDALLGQDEFCGRYIAAWRAGELG
jgi:5-methyltetrahydrofolate--homocysteine methyltransferase